MGKEESNLTLEEDISRRVRGILVSLGVDPESPNFKETPRRVARSFIELTVGLRPPGFTIKTFPTFYRGMVIVDPIVTVGLCPHHLMPIEYQIYIGYIPNRKVLGLSKLPRLVEWLAHRPVLQEDLTDDITNFIEGKLKSKGVAVIVRGIHGCMKYRGVRQGCEATTSTMTGSFKRSFNTRNEFLKLIKL